MNTVTLEAPLATGAPQRDAQRVANYYGRIGSGLESSVPLVVDARKELCLEDTSPTPRFCSSGFTCKGDEARHEEVAATLRMLFTRHLFFPEHHIASEVPLNRMGLDSLALGHLAAAIDLELGVYVPSECFAEGLTIAKLIELIALQRSQLDPIPFPVSERYSADCVLLCA